MDVDYQNEARRLLDAVMYDDMLVETDVIVIDWIIFNDRVESFDIPEKEIAEVVKFYKAVDGMYGKFKNTPLRDPGDPNELLFEFWEMDKRLWLGQKDMDTLTWKDSKFHLGCASELNYGSEYVFDSMLGLLEKCLDDWNEVWKR